MGYVLIILWKKLNAVSYGKASQRIYLSYTNNNAEERINGMERANIAIQLPIFHQGFHNGQSVGEEFL